MVRQVSTNKKWPPLGERFVISEFMEVEDAALRRKRWFPKKAHGHFELEVLDARLNPVFPNDRFSPPIPDGTHVVYWDQRVAVPGMNSTRVKSEITGGATGAEIRRKLSNENALRERDEHLRANEKTAIAQQYQSWRKILVIALVLSIVTGVLWRRSRRRAR